MNVVEIHYCRPLHGTTVFQQTLLHREPGCIVTFMEQTELLRPVYAAERVILEPGAPVVWFTFDDAWHDIGRFHTADGRFAGCYANILTPVSFETPLRWRTTDLCLDIWLDADGSRMLLDEAELADAVSAGSISVQLAESARREAVRLLDAAAAGTWPPAIVSDWPLGRARDMARNLGRDIV